MCLMYFFLACYRNRQAVISDYGSSFLGFQNCLLKIAPVRIWKKGKF